ncbi:uncharacterized protein EI97DRAFT_435374 [Westerdykella ornata]|uniref:Nucleoporin Nup54 alpha-helical domain-containing protein n=1 Tax=Westerdykella ornata TaxID=318751 RepID=A0A6A6JE57_WESOR|nr:uncharacterized protein EI97DRAFT_435374 [Westerdykella ornata]KAF2274288.1 hypothetical protein EI97DRAFT_435374 [Westerdykella ornata]
MSLFGSLGGTSGGTTERKTGTLFGSTSAPSTGLFAQNQQQNAPQQQTSSLFGAPKPAAGGLFGASQTQQSQQPSGGLFGASQSQPAQSSLFGNPAPGTSSLFGNTQQQQQQQQQQPLGSSFFGTTLQPAPSLPQLAAQQLQQSQQGLPPLRQTANSQFASTLVSGQREKSVVDQMITLEKKWTPTERECAFQYYFYNKVKPEEVPFYTPQDYEDPNEWEQALSKKPSDSVIPVLYRGFEQVAERIKTQNFIIAGLQTRLHQINTALELIKSSHELEIASRIAEARRKHIVFTQRTLALAAKVQILRNRGYAMDQAEEELKKKLQDLEKRSFDPVLSGRQEEIWARMSGVRERARILQEETDKLGKTLEGQQDGAVLSEEDQKNIDKLLKDYDKQLEHLKKWVDDTKQEYEEWENERRPQPRPAR